MTEYFEKYDEEEIKRVRDKISLLETELALSEQSDLPEINLHEAKEFEL